MTFGKEVLRIVPLDDRFGAHLSWPYIVEWPSCCASGDADHILRDRNSLLHLRSVFGESLAAIPLPLLERLLNAAPWTYEWVPWLSDALTRLGSTPGYESLRRRLVDPDQFMEALSVLDIAERFQVVGIEISFDPQVRVGSAVKVPDLLLTNEAMQSAFICEVSVLFTADTHVWQSELLNRIFGLLVEPRQDRLFYAGRIFPGASKQDIGGLANRIAWEIMEAEREGAWREVTIEGILMMAFGPEPDAALVRAWADARGMELGSLGATLTPIDQIQRLRAKISDKATQLAPDKPKLLMIWAQDLFIDVNDVTRLPEQVLATLASYPKVSAIVLGSEVSGEAGDHQVTDVR